MKVAVLGCGNMTTPIIKRIHALDPSIEFLTYTPSKVRAEALAKEVKGLALDNINEFKDIDIWFLGIKPQQLDQLAEELGDKLKNSKVISILAATSLEKQQNILKTNSLIRIMPNTPVEYAQGISLIYKSETVEQDFYQQTKAWFESCGLVHLCNNEKEFDQLTLFSGSGPGYFLYIAQAYYQKMLSLGFDEKVSKGIISQLFLGVGTLSSKRDEGFKILQEQVTSKGGVTAAALEILDQDNLTEIISKSIDSGINRSDQLSQL